MADRLATAFRHAAMGAITPRDEEAVIAVFDAERAQVTRADLVEAAALRFGTALAVALRAGSPRKQTLQAFLDLLAAGHLSETPGALVLEPNSTTHPMTVRVAEEALRIALDGAGVTSMAVRRAPT